MVSGMEFYLEKDKEITRKATVPRTLSFCQHSQNSRTEKHDRLAELRKHQATKRHQKIA